jgi:hypothetical protein
MRSAAFAILLAACASERAPDAESRARDAFAARVTGERGLAATWALVSRGDLVFDDGFAPLEMIDPASPGAPLRGPLLAPPAGAIPVRWIGARALLRVYAPARVEIRGRVDVARLFARPRVVLTTDGREAAAALVDADGHFALATTTAAAGWSDVYLTVSSVAEPWRAPAELRIARVEGVVVTR